jgi:hypothetical protein
MESVLAKVNSDFGTFEARGGSSKPSGKRLSEANLHSLRTTAWAWGRAHASVPDCAFDGGTGGRCCVENVRRFCRGSFATQRAEFAGEAALDFASDRAIIALSR